MATMYLTLVQGQVERASHVLQCHHTDMTTNCANMWEDVEDYLEVNCLDTERQAQTLEEKDKEQWRFIWELQENLADDDRAHADKLRFFSLFLLETLK